MAAVEHRFRVMASEAQVLVVDGGATDAAWAEARLRGLEARWSRFVADSDISRLNRAEGQPVVVSDDTATLVAAMVEGWRLTAGRFDPSTLPDLVTAGYARSVDDPMAVTVLPATATAGADLGTVVVDREGATVTLPPGAALDPGGVGKGLAADLVADALLGRGCAGALVSLGGDLAVRGRPPAGERWSVAVEDPVARDHHLTDLHLDGGGVATSSTLGRRWRHDDGERHHLIDPRTGRPSATDVASVTVVADAAWRAEVLATAAVLGGAADAIAYLDGQGVDGVVVDLHGIVTSTLVPEPVR